MIEDGSLAYRMRRRDKVKNTSRGRGLEVLNRARGHFRKVADLGRQHALGVQKKVSYRCRSQEYDQEFSIQLVDNCEPVDRSMHVTAECL